MYESYPPAAKLGVLDTGKDDNEEEDIFSTPPTSLDEYVICLSVHPSHFSHTPFYCLYLCSCSCSYKLSILCIPGSPNS